MEYKYTTTFNFEVKACEEIAGINLSQANIENLRSLIPTSVDLKKNIDLMGVAFNAAVVNEFNKNGDGIDTKTALDSIQQFIHKPTNIEHNKSKIVGHIVNAGFSDYADSSILINVDEKETNPFHIALGAVVYKTIDKDFFELLQKSTNPDNKMYNTVSASWEVGFSEYQIAVGSKNLKDARVVSDPKEIQNMKPMLRAFGGKGVTDEGEPIYRLITGSVYPLGIGFTLKPAANVKGVISNNLEEVEVKKEAEEQAVSDKEDSQATHLKKICTKISQKIKNTVNNNKIMDLETLLSEIKASLTEKKFSEEAIAGMTSTFADAIKQKDEEYKASLEAAEKEKSEIASAKEELQASVESIKEELKVAQERINEFEAAKLAEEAVATFNSRMEEIDSIYDLEESDSAFIAEKIKALDSSEEAFASFKDELAVFWASKNKEAKAKQEEAIAARVEAEIEKRLSTSEASETVAEEVSVEDALENAEATDESIPNNNEAQASSQTLRDKFAAAFSRENVLA